ncbi:hypothetical protein [Phocaeicola plebeius]|jgi:hypothetical protein|nr:hypothetical protein [Phocaeicola plebeius]
MGPEFYASDLDDCLNLNPEMLSSVKSYTVKGEIYETSHTVLYDALNEGTSGVHNERRPVSSELLYDEVYRPPFYIYTGVVLKDKNGEELWNWGDKAPFEIYLPNTPEGEQGAVPHLTFMSRYILVVTVEMKVENNGRENTIVSSHTFVPRFRWDYYNSGDWYYNVYPFVPIEN